MSQQPTSQSLARDACIVAAARIARERGFAAADEGALEALADVVRASVRALARRAAANARHATRSELALNDVLSALKQSPSNNLFVCAHRLQSPAQVGGPEADSLFDKCAVGK